MPVIMAAMVTNMSVLVLHWLTGAVANKGRTRLNMECHLIRSNRSTGSALLRLILQ